MPHVIEAASTGRAKCRGCGAKIAAGELRFGERLPNPFAEGETTLWFHVDCGAFKRPEAFLEALAANETPLGDVDVPRLESEAKKGVEHRRLPRVNGAERAPTGRAQCRACRQAIAKGAWRLSLVFFEEGRFSPSGYVHASCAAAYLETIDVMPRVRRFSPSLGEEDVNAIEAELASSPPPSPPSS
jgi:ribosomal protein L37AE/L43A